MEFLSRLQFDYSLLREFLYWDSCESFTIIYTLKRLWTFLVDLFSIVYADVTRASGEEPLQSLKRVDSLQRVDSLERASL